MAIVCEGSKLLDVFCQRPCQSIRPWQLEVLHASGPALYLLSLSLQLQGFHCAQLPLIHMCLSVCLSVCLYVCLSAATCIQVRSDHTLPVGASGPQIHVDGD